MPHTYTHTHTQPPNTPPPRAAVSQCVCNSRVLYLSANHNTAFHIRQIRAFVNKEDAKYLLTCFLSYISGYFVYVIVFSLTGKSYVPFKVATLHEPLIFFEYHTTFMNNATLNNRVRILRTYVRNIRTYVLLMNM